MDWTVESDLIITVLVVLRFDKRFEAMNKCDRQTVFLYYETFRVSQSSADIS
jgi:hypothetical protein